MDLHLLKQKVIELNVSQTLSLEDLQSALNEQNILASWRINPQDIIDYFLVTERYPVFEQRPDILIANVYLTITSVSVINMDIAQYQAKIEHTLTELISDPNIVFTQDDMDYIMSLGKNYQSWAEINLGSQVTITDVQNCLLS